MKTDIYQMVGGKTMYTKIVRKIAEFIISSNGHCGGGGGSGHCS